MKTSDRRHWEEFWGRARELKEIYSTNERTVAAIEKICDVKGKRVLEVGAGTGRDSNALAQKGAEVYVLDYSNNSLALVEEQNAAENLHMQPVQADAFRTPFKDKSFDIIFHQGLIEHFTDFQGILDENYRVLKDDGLLVVDVPQRWHVYTLMKHILIALDKWFAGWETEFSVGELERILKDTGFKSIDFYGEWMYPSLFYRLLRETLWKLSIRLPLYPPKVPLLWRLRKVFREGLPEFRPFIYTVVAFGVICTKEERG